MTFYWVMGAYSSLGLALFGLMQRRAGAERNSGLQGRLAWLGRMLLMLTVWPLWAPVAWAEGQEGRAASTVSTYSERIQKVLEEARAAVAGTELNSLVPSALVAGVTAAARAVESRCAELRRLLTGLGPASAGTTPGEEANATGRREHNLLRLRTVLVRDERLLVELLQLAESLHVQLLLARYSGQPAAQAREAAGELGAQVEAFEELFRLEVGALPCREPLAAERPVQHDDKSSSHLLSSAPACPR